MTTIDIDPPLLVGSAHERGRALAQLAAPHADAVRSRALEARDVAGGDSGWVREQWRAQHAHVPEIAALVEGMADGFGLAAETLFAAHLRYAVEDRRRHPVPDGEGCSTFAVRRTDGSVLLAKNRDNRAYFSPLQQLVRQRDPAWGGREILCVGSFGSIPSASSGINSDGFCMTDTAVRTHDLGIGVLRYNLMEALLVRCANVAEALAAIRGWPHVGGGNMLLADAGGAVAAVEIGHSAVDVAVLDERGWIARTNHHLAAGLAHKLIEPPGSPPRENSESRLRGLTRHLSGWNRNPEVGDCAALLAEHGAAHGHAAICRHGEDAATHSGVVFEPATLTLHLSRGNPCLDLWQRVRLTGARRSPATLSLAHEGTP